MISDFSLLPRHLKVFFNIYFVFYLYKFTPSKTIQMQANRPLLSAVDKLFVLEKMTVRRSRNTWQIVLQILLKQKTKADLYQARRCQKDLGKHIQGWRKQRSLMSPWQWVGQQVLCLTSPRHLGNRCRILALYFSTVLLNIELSTWQKPSHWTIVQWACRVCVMW